MTAKNYSNEIASLFIFKKNSIKKATSSKQILETRNSFKNFQNQEMSW